MIHSSVARLNWTHPSVADSLDPSVGCEAELDTFVGCETDSLDPSVGCKTDSLVPSVGCDTA